MATPIKFGTDGWRAIIGADFTFDNLARVTDALLRYLKQTQERPQVLIGYDCRFNGRLFSEAVATRLAAAGCKVFLTPTMTSTPMVSLATLQKQCDMGVVITASHNPPEYSGFKLKGAYGGPAYPSIVADVENLIPDVAPAVSSTFERELQAGNVEYYDAEALYLNHIKQSFDLKLIQERGLRLAYDAMYGAGQRAMQKLFPAAELLHCEMNPGFHGQAPEPIERNLHMFKALMTTGLYDWGLATDGDADRIGLFDEKGRFVDSHHILLLLINYLHKTQNKKGKVVVTFSVTSKVEAMCKQYGLELEITKIGFKYIGEIMARENVLVGGEESGGIACTGHIPERDGIYIGLVLLEFMARTGKKLTELVDEIYALVGRFWMDRRDLHVTEAQKLAVLDKCKSGGFTAFGSYNVQRTETIDGFKFHLHTGEWVMIRASGTEPVLRVYCETTDEAAAAVLLDATVAAILE